MSPDRDALAAAVGHQEASAGWLEVALPLWHRKWWIVLGTLLGAVGGFVLVLFQPVRFTGQASFIVQPASRISPSAAVAPALAGLLGTGASPVDMYVAILRSQLVADRIIDRFELQRVWEMPLRAQVNQRLNKRVSFGIGRRDGLVQVTVEDDNPQRAAAMANEYVEELRNTLRTFSLGEARQRREFYDVQLARARVALEEAQKKLQASGFDRAALRAEPRAAADSYGRLQAEVTSAEVKLAATRRVRSEGSAEVQQQLSELGALRAQLAKIEVPKEGGPGSFVSRVREFRYAESVADAIARQADAARVEEAAEGMPLQVLDRASVPELPSSPRLMLWILAAALAGLTLSSALSLLRHRAAMARLDGPRLQRIELIRSVLRRRSD